MHIKPMPQFITSAGRLLSAREIMEVHERLSRDPHCGTRVSLFLPTIQKIQHPLTGVSDRGYRPVVVYIVDESSKEIILVDVVQDNKTLMAWVMNPRNWPKLVVLAKAIRDILEQVL